MNRRIATTSKKRKSSTHEAPAAISLVADKEAADMLDQDQTEAASSAAPNKPNLDKALGKRELIDRVVIASGIKKKAVKPVIEALLKELGDALSRGDTLNLQPFGKANVKRHKELEHAEIIELRLRRSKLAIKAAEDAREDQPADPLAEAAE